MLFRRHFDHNASLIASHNMQRTVITINQHISIGGPRTATYPRFHSFIHQRLYSPFLGPGRVFQFRNPIHSGQDSLNGWFNLYHFKILLYNILCRPLYIDPHITKAGMIIVSQLAVLFICVQRYYYPFPSHHRVIKWCDQPRSDEVTVFWGQSFNPSGSRMRNSKSMEQRGAHVWRFPKLDHFICSREHVLIANIYC